MPSFFSKDAEDGWHRLVEDVAKRARERDSKDGVRYRLYRLTLCTPRCSSLRYYHRCDLLDR
jgi:hypothetical protein